MDTIFNWLMIDSDRYILTTIDSLYEIDKTCGCSKWVPCENCYAMETYDKWVYMAPMEGSQFQVLDLSTKQLRFIKIQYEDNIYCANKFYSAHRFGDYLFFFPGKYPYIVRLNVLNDEIVRFPIDTNQLNTGSNELLFSESIYCFNNKVYLGAWNTGIIVSFDLISGQIEYYKTDVNDGIRSLCGYKDIIIAADAKGYIYILDTLKGSTKVKRILCEQGKCFRKSIVKNGKAFFLSEDDGEYYVIDIETMNYHMGKIKTDKIISEEGPYGKLYDENGYIYILDTKKKRIILLDDEFKIIGYSEILIKKEEIHYLGDNKIYFEGHVGLDYYISKMMNRER